MANRPVLSYVLELLELSNLKDIIVVWFFLLLECVLLHFPFWGIVFFFFFFLCVLMCMKVAEGEDVALRIGSWISGAYDERLRVEVLSCFCLIELLDEKLEHEVAFLHPFSQSRG